MKKLTYKPNNTATKENSPGSEIFLWRSVLLVLFLIIISGGYYLQFNEAPLSKKLIYLSVIIILLILEAYSLFMFVYFKTLKYELNKEQLEFKSALYRRKISLKEIGSSENISHRKLRLVRKAIWTYFREVPQITHPVGQFGNLTLEEIGKVFFMSTIASFDEPKNLILITTNKSDRYAISPQNPEEFLNQLNKRRQG